MSNTGYKAILFAPDGDWVTDYKSETVDEVWRKVSDQGSRWFFYPFTAVIRDRGTFTSAGQHIVDSNLEFPNWKGRSIEQVRNIVRGFTEDDLALIFR